MIYELRTYWAAPEKREALHQRFQTLTFGVFARHQMQVVGFWTPEPITEESGDLVYLLAFPDRPAREHAWAAFRADPEWQAGKVASEVDGTLTRKITSTILQPTDYSPSPMEKNPK
ncbi:MAG: NIPSNAP family protein [Chloroflexi bacterium]|nr:NIPSNAP family protein [Chloroflexota bacterium]